MNLPDRNTRDAVELYNVLLRACVLASINDEDTLSAVREWLRGAGMEDFEFYAMTALIDGNIECDQ